MDGLEPSVQIRIWPVMRRSARPIQARSLHLAQAAADQDLAAGVPAAEVRDGLDAGTDGQQDGLQANLEDDLEASRPRRWTRAEALAEAERLDGMAGAVFLMHWEKSSGGA